MKLTAAIALTGVLAATQAAPPPQTPPPPKPTRIVPAPERNEPGLVSKTMAGLDAMSFASALAKAGHAAGFVMPNSVRQGMLPPDSGEMITLDEAVALFTASGSYKAERQGGVLVFRHSTVPADVADALVIARQRYPIRGEFAVALYDVVLRGLARRPVGAPAGREPAAGPDCPVGARVTVPAGRASAIETMNALVARTKGVAWMVRFGQRRDPLRLQVGYVCANGAWSALSVPGW